MLLKLPVKKLTLKSEIYCHISILDSMHSMHSICVDLSFREECNPQVTSETPSSF